MFSRYLTLVLTLSIFVWDGPGPSHAAGAEPLKPTGTMPASLPADVRQVPQTARAEPVYSVAYSPDGRLILSGGDTSVKLWDRATGTLIRLLSSNTPTVAYQTNSVAFSPDGKKIAAGGTFPIEDQISGFILVWDLASGKQIGQFGLDEGMPLSSIAFAPDGKSIASASAYRPTVTLWDVTTGKATRTFDSQNAGAVSAVFSPDGSLLALGGTDEKIEIWDVASAKRLRTFQAVGPVASLSFAPDGKTIVSNSLMLGLELWDVTTGGPIRRFDSPAGLTAYSKEYTDTASYAVAYSADGRSVLSASLGKGDDLLRLWDVASGKIIKTFEGHSDVIRGVAFAPDGRSIVSGGRDGVPRVWDPASGTLLRTLGSSGDPVSVVAASPDGRYVASFSGSTIRLWDLQQGRLLKSWQPDAGEEDEGKQDTLVFAPDGKSLLSRGGAKTFKLWTIPDAKLLQSHPAASTDTEAFAFTPNGQHLITGGSLGSPITIWDLAMGKPLRQVKGPDIGAMRSIAVSPDGLRFVTSDGYTISLWSAATGKAVWTINLEDQLTVGGLDAIVFAADGKSILGAGPFVTKRFSAANGKLIKDYEKDGSAATDFTKDGKFLLSGGDGGHITLTPTASGKLAKSLAASDGEIGAVAFSGGPNAAVSAADDGSVQVWDLKGGKLVATLVAKYDDWAVLTPQGAFTASGDIGKLLAIVRGTEVLPIDEFIKANRRDSLDLLAALTR